MGEARKGANAPRIGLTTGMLGVATAMSVASLAWGAMLPVVLGIGGILSALLLLRPDAGTVLFLALAYSNAVALVGLSVGDTSYVAAAFTVLLMLPVFVHAFVRKRGLVIDRPLLLMFLFLGSLFLSSLVAKDSSLAFKWIVTYVTEGLLLYFLLVNTIRRLSTLKAVVWTLLITCSVLCVLGMYQELTGDYETQFGGLAQRNVERLDEVTATSGSARRNREGIHTSHRAAGPMGDANRFAQILLMVLPLAVMRVHDEKGKRKKLLAFACAALILGGIFITYSRGGFLTLMLLIVLMTGMRYFKIRHVLLAGVGSVILVAILAPGYLGRIDTMTDMSRFFQPGGEKKSGDGAIRGRLTEMLAATNVFLDYPLLGVGPGQYSKHYSKKYMADPSIQFRRIDKTRRAHTLVSELAAETGLVGLVIFFTIAGTTMIRLLQLRARWRGVSAELTNLVTGLFLGLVGYFGTSIFLHLSYQRYYWIFLAISGAAVQIIGSHDVPSEVVAAEKKRALPDEAALEFLEA